MNFSLHLQTIFTFIRQNKANSQKKTTHTHIQELHQTLACYALELDDCGSVLAKRCPGNTVHAHIHIYSYQGPGSCQMSQTHTFCLFARLNDFPRCLISGPSAPIFMALSWPCLSAAQLLAFIFRMLSWVGKINAWVRGVSECLCWIRSHSEPLRRCCQTTVRRNPESPAGQTSEGHRWWACYTQSRRHLAEV